MCGHFSYIFGSSYPIYSNCLTKVLNIQMFIHTNLSIPAFVNGYSSSVVLKLVDKFGPAVSALAKPLMARPAQCNGLALLQYHGHDEYLCSVGGMLLSTDCPV